MGGKVVPLPAIKTLANVFDHGEMWPEKLSQFGWTRDFHLRDLRDLVDRRFKSSWREKLP
jgi:hypothetical protein